jgi:hypothetical protein
VVVSSRGDLETLVVASGARFDDHKTLLVPTPVPSSESAEKGRLPGVIGAQEFAN